MKYVPGGGNPNAKLMVVGEAPGADEEAAANRNSNDCTMVGPAGKLIQTFISQAGGHWSGVWRTNVLKYRPPDNKIPRLKEIGLTWDSTLDQLWSEIDQVKPNCILAFGGTALKALTGKLKINDWRGSILLTSKGFPKVVPTIHPSGLLKAKGMEGYLDYKWKFPIQFDVKRAVEESKYPAYNIPQRHLQIARSSLDLFRFFRAYEGKWIYTADIETSKAIPTMISFAFNPGHAISVPLLNVQSANNPTGIPQHDLVEIWKLIDKIFRDSRYKVIGQNWKFDAQRLECIGFKPPVMYADTSLMAHTLYPEYPVNLGFLASLRTREPFYKDEGREFDITKQSIDDLHRYNANDSAVDYEVFESLFSELKELHLEEFYFEFVNPLHELYIGIEKEGLNTNQDKKAELLKKYLKRDENVEAELFKLIGHEVNVRSPNQIKELIYVELKCPLRKDTNEDTLTGLMVNALKDPRKIKIIELILESRQVKKTISTYLLANEDYDGRMRTQFRICGTETGRSSTSVLKSPVRPHQVGLAFHTVTKHGDVGSDLRYMFDADEGYIFQEFDLSQAEARVVALLANDDELLEAFDRVDVHKVTAHWFFFNNLHHLPISKITNDMVSMITGEMRFVGKSGRHGGHYDEGKRRLMHHINTDARKYGINISVSEWKAGQIIEVFHARSPKIRGVFHAEVRKALERDRVLLGPFGRRRQFFGRWDEDLFKEGYAQIPQDTVATQTKLAALRAKKIKPTIRIVKEAHDALLLLSKVSEIKEDQQIMIESMELPIDFDRCTLQRGTLKIPCEVKLGYNYKELKKV